MNFKKFAQDFWVLFVLAGVLLAAVAYRILQ